MENSKLTDYQKSLLSFLKIIWLAMISTLLTYAFVLFKINNGFGLIGNTSNGQTNENIEIYYNNFLFMPLLLVAIVCFTAAFIIPKIFFFKIGASQSKAYTEVKNGASIFSNPAAGQSLKVAFIIRLALLEAVAIYGFCLSFITHQIEPYIYFASAAFIGFLLSFPTPNNIKKLCGDKTSP
jgi:hypothetical protein